MGPIRVACIGDSITEGFGISDRSNNSYPAQLGKKLGSSHRVKNFGRGGRTALRNTSLAYHKTGQYNSSLSFNPNIAVIMLGTNDSREGTWQGSNQFISDYKTLIKKYKDRGAKVYVCKPPSTFNPRVNGPIRTAQKQTSSKYINLSGGISLFDGIHPDAAGAKTMAKRVASAID